METPSALLVRCEGTPLVADELLSQMINNVELWRFVSVSRYSLLKIHYSLVATDLGAITLMLRYYNYNK